MCRREPTIGRLQAPEGPPSAKLETLSRMCAHVRFYLRGSAAEQIRDEPQNAARNEVADYVKKHLDISHDDLYRAYRQTFRAAIESER